MKSPISIFLLYFLSNCGLLFSQSLDYEISQGERLKYNVKYGFLKAGELDIKIHDSVNYKYLIPCYLVEINGDTKGTTDFISPIHDYWASYIDSVTKLPYAFKRNLRENKYRLYEETYFEREEGRVSVGRLKENKMVVKQYPIPNGTHDMVSAYFFLRTLPNRILRRKDTLQIPVFLGDTTYTMDILILDNERIKTPFGKFRCFVIAPLIEENKIFRGNYPIKAWITNDSDRIPIKVKAKLFFGSVEVNIREINGVKGWRYRKLKD